MNAIHSCFSKDMFITNYQAYRVCVHVCTLTQVLRTGKKWMARELCKGITFWKTRSFHRRLLGPIIISRARGGAGGQEWLNSARPQGACSQVQGTDRQMDPGCVSAVQSQGSGKHSGTREAPGPSLGSAS